MNVLLLRTGDSCRTIHGQAAFNHRVPRGCAQLKAKLDLVGAITP
ncbi:MAG: hypothetical protein ABIT83_10840 [Massilia sp.]